MTAKNRAAAFVLAIGVVALGLAFVVRQVNLNRLAAVQDKPVAAKEEPKPEADSLTPELGQSDGLNKQSCETAGGKWNECGSACGDQASGTACIQMCVQQCECKSELECPSGSICRSGVCKDKLVIPTGTSTEGVIQPSVE